MEIQATVFPGKSQPVKSRYNRRTTPAIKSDAKELLSVHRRVFGTARNSNIVERSLPEKPKWQKPSLKPVPITSPLKEPINKTTSNRNPRQSKPLPQVTTKPPIITQLVQTTPEAQKEQPKMILVETTPLAEEEPPKPAQQVETAPLAPEEPPNNALLVPEMPPAQPADTTSLTPEEPPNTAHLVSEKPPNTVQPVQTTHQVAEEPPNTTQTLQIAPMAPEQPSKTVPLVPEEPPTTLAAPEDQTKAAPYNKHKKKKSVSFRQANERDSSTGPAVEGERTPRPVKAKKRVSGTPYHTAERCNKCRFDRMETASYWLAQVKLAEGVGKHNVSAGLFKLALESKAEPARVLRAELKRYMSRNTYLPRGEPEWRDVIASYGLDINPNDQFEVKAHDENGSDPTEQITEQLESNLED